MKRLTKRKEDWYWKGEEFWLSAENPTLEEADNVYYKLAEFEDFMEEMNCESLEDISEVFVKFKKNIDVIYQLKQENEELKNEIQKMNNINLNLYLFLIDLRNSFHKGDETYEEIDKKLKELGGGDNDK